ncbi:uroporphyrinogen-III synthase [Curvibacter sp. APW13]|uniref:uroporphyrinogen-III synthase n=1 Tax=Curvibacter sp. APW13 TaxID=3077236 RepID=UPI0028DEB9ED|nr:uroporphyrinogen-III synthase [Curvibacter sp. APW13]MDT8990909.1 uroporphyrinogen-III synthase [Curvibacter sp. APW13]
MRVVVTRPARDAAPWVAALAQQGYQPWALPLIAVAPVADAAPVRATWARGPWSAALFVSANAVDAFFALNWPEVRRNTAWTASKTIAFAPGPGTRKALLAQGVAEDRIVSPASDSAQFDSEALWQQAQGLVGAGFRLLVVRGTTQGSSSQDGVGRDWLAAQVVARGGTVEHVVVYERVAPVLSIEERAKAEQCAQDGSVWLFSSSEAIANLRTALPEQGWAQARAVCTHPRIAQAAQAAGFGLVCTTRPALDSVVASIQSLQ